MSSYRLVIHKIKMDKVVEEREAPPISPRPPGTAPLAIHVKLDDLPWLNKRLHHVVGAQSDSVAEAAVLLLGTLLSFSLSIPERGW
jgi:hypothetical protein